MAKASKGGKYEREFCTNLSLWWTGGKRDDIFWRSSNSGGRATTRRKKGQATQGQCGDVAATDPVGNALIDLITIEIKRGYSKVTAFDILDRPERVIHHKIKPQSMKKTFEGMVMQTIAAAANANSFSWMLVVRRDDKNAFVFLPMRLLKKLMTLEELVSLYPSMCMHTKIKSSMPGIKSYRIRLAGMTLATFFESVSPKTIKKLARNL